MVVVMVTAAARTAATGTMYMHTMANDLTQTHYGKRFNTNTIW